MTSSPRATPDQGSAELSDDDLNELAYSAYEEAMSFGLSHETFLRYFKTIRDRAAATQGAPRVDLHAAIMNLPLKRTSFQLYDDPDLAHECYFAGHRDARHAAAELVAAQGAPTPAQAEPLRVGVRQIVSALRNREWADLLTSDDDLADLEEEVGKLIGARNAA